MKAKRNHVSMMYTYAHLYILPSAKWAKQSQRDSLQQQRRKLFAGPKTDKQTNKQINKRQQTKANKSLGHFLGI